MGRAEAKRTFTMSQMRKDLEEKGVTLIGGGLDECSMGYKDINDVMTEQKDLVEVMGVFLPKIVRMAGEEKKPWHPA